MRLIILFSAIGVLATGCITPIQTGKSPYPGPDGRYETYPQDPANLAGCDDLVVIEANDTAKGIEMENDYIEKTWPGSRKIGQSLSQCGSGMVDIITIQQPDGTTRDVWFDISSFFGKVRGRDIDDLLDE